MPTIYTKGVNIQKDSFTPEILGGKGYGLARMADLGMPVPEFLVIGTDCIDYSKHSSSTVHLRVNTIIRNDEVQEFVNSVFSNTGLVSVRSGARVSMPGMMDTILNVGINHENYQDYVEKYGAGRAYTWAIKCQEMYLSSTHNVPDALLKKVADKVMGFKYGLKKHPASIKEYTERHFIKHMELLKGLAMASDAVIPFYATLEAQLVMCVKGVFNSWFSERAKEYRKLHGYPENWGTAAIIQKMVFGDYNENSCTGVCFTRNPNTGEHGLYGEYMIGAQGEDIVSGTHTPSPIHEMATTFPEAFKKLNECAVTLERHFRDMQDIEFTVEDGELYILQTRSGKRSKSAALKIARDMIEAGYYDKPLLKHIKPDWIFGDEESHLTIEDGAREPDFTGLPASGGIVSGSIHLDSEHYVLKIPSMSECVFVAEETRPEDFSKMAASLAIVTAKGGATSHAAVVARSIGKPCVVGVGTDLMDVHLLDKILVDGYTGRVWVGDDLPKVVIKKSGVSDDVKWLRDYLANAINFTEYARDVEPSEVVHALIANDEDVISVVEVARIQGVREVYARLMMNVFIPEDAPITSLFGPEAEKLYSASVSIDPIVKASDDLFADVYIFGATVNQKIGRVHLLADEVENLNDNDVISSVAASKFVKKSVENFVKNGGRVIQQPELRSVEDALTTFLKIE
jgi:pyruvate,orthophosphate dikinase